MLGVVQLKLGLNSEDKELNSKISVEYLLVLDIFGKRMADDLPPYHSFNHAINLSDGKDLPWYTIYALSAVALNV
jgi:hypothetical protein